MAKRKYHRGPNSPVRMVLGVNSLDNNRGSGGLEINVPGFQGDPLDGNDAPCQIFLEYYEGKLQAHIWNGTSSEPQTIFFPRK
jgi:hypothetical protein